MTPRTTSHPSILATTRRLRRGALAQQQRRGGRVASSIFTLLMWTTPAVALAAPTDAASPPAELSGQAPTSTAVTPAIGERLLRANSYLEEGRHDDALAVVDDLARVRRLESADRAQIHRFRGYILIAQGDTEGAGQEFELALAEKGLDDSARQGMSYSLAQIYTQAGKYDQARTLLDSWFATATDPKPEAFFLKAMILVQQEAYRDALVPAQEAIAKSGQPRESWLQLLAAIQFQLQDYPGVAGTLRQLLVVAPGTKRYWVQLATIENSIGQEDKALATLGVAHVAGLLEEDREIRQRARLCFVRDLPQCCAQALEEGMTAGKVGKDAESYQLLANCYIAARDTDKALEPLAKAGELSKDGKGFLLLGQLQLQKERFDSAHAALVKARSKSPSEQRASIDLLLGIADLGEQRFDAAEQSFRLAQADEKTRPAADSYLKHLEQRRALQEMQSSIAGDPEGGSDSTVSDANTAPSSPM